MSLCSPQIQHKVACKCTRASVVEGGRPWHYHRAETRRVEGIMQPCCKWHWQRYIKMSPCNADRRTVTANTVRSGCNSKDGTEVSKRGACVPKERAIRTGRMQNRFKITDLTSLNSIHFTEFRPRRRVIQLSWCRKFSVILWSQQTSSPQRWGHKVQVREEGGQLLVNSF
jgi:hypothetical protein